MPGPVRAAISVAAPETADQQRTRWPWLGRQGHERRRSAGQASTQTLSRRARPSTSSRRRLPPAPIAVLEAAGHWAAAGGAQLLLVPMQADRAPLLGSGAAPAQRAVLAPAGEAGPARAGDRCGVAREAPDRASLPVDPEVVDGEPARTALCSGMGLIVWLWPAARVAPDP
jgi:hypothetical protein